MLPPRRIVHHREPDAERGAFAFAFADRLDGSAMHFDNMSRDGQTQPESTVAARQAAVGLAKPFEHVRQEFRRDADACIADREHHV